MDGCIRLETAQRNTCLWVVEVTPSGNGLPQTGAATIHAERLTQPGEEAGPGRRPVRMTVSYHLKEDSTQENESKILLTNSWSCNLVVQLF